MDVVGYAKDDTGICLQIFFVRSGKLIGRENFFLPTAATAAGSGNGVYQAVLQ